MPNGIEASVKYGRVELVCDDEELARLRGLVLADFKVVEAIGDRVGSNNARILLIMPPPPADPPGPRGWYWQLVWGFLGGVPSLIAMIVGFVTIYHWLLRHLG